MEIRHIFSCAAVGDGLLLAGGIGGTPCLSGARGHAGHFLGVITFRPGHGMDVVLVAGDEL